jgi:hypothetical protein
MTTHANAWTREVTLRHVRAYFSIGTTDRITWTDNAAKAGRIVDEAIQDHYDPAADVVKALYLNLDGEDDFKSRKFDPLDAIAKAFKKAGMKPESGHFFAAAFERDWNRDVTRRVSPAPTARELALLAIAGHGDGSKAFEDLLSTTCGEFTSLEMCRAWVDVHVWLDIIQTNRAATTKAKKAKTRRKESPPTAPRLHEVDRPL